MVGMEMLPIVVLVVAVGVAAALAGAFGAFWLNRQMWAATRKCA